METLQTLGLALGLATLAGLNLYLTVFVAGLAIQQHWITLLPQYEQLHVLAHPAIIALSGAMYLLQFFADKVPWVDSLWDAVHTIIRPLGGAFLAVRVLGTPDPVYDVIIALLAGGVTFVAHSVKAGTRLVANHSPEPFSNIALSVSEDVAVLGGLALINHDPVLALIVFSALLLLACYFVPKLYRSVKVNLWFLWRKLSFPSSDHPDHELRAELPADLHVLFHQANLLSERMSWAVPCVSAQSAPDSRERLRLSGRHAGGADEALVHREARLAQDRGGTRRRHLQGRARAEVSERKPGPLQPGEEAALPLLFRPHADRARENRRRLHPAAPGQLPNRRTR
jgi:hypothetical protein